MHLQLLVAATLVWLSGGLVHAAPDGARCIQKIAPYVTGKTARVGWACRLR